MVFDYAMKYLQQLKTKYPDELPRVEIYSDGSGCFRKGTERLWSFDDLNDLEDKLIKRVVGGK